MTRSTILLAVLFFAAAGTVLAQVPPEERIPITNPARLREMGFPPDSKNVYLWSKAAPTTSEAPGEKGPSETETWGTELGYSTLAGTELKAQWDEFHRLVRSENGLACSDNTYIGDALYPYAYSQVQVPEGASLERFLFWAQDSDPDRDLLLVMLETCQDLGRSAPVTTVIANTSTIGSIGYYQGNVSLHGLTANNRLCTYIFKVGLAKCDLSKAKYIHKLQVGWKRQVSPGPAVASFLDVPTTHPFFRYVEALKKAGIAAGCTPGNFCPNDPVTRGQMAVYLSTALGLQWP